MLSCNAPGSVGGVRGNAFEVDFGDFLVFLGARLEYQESSFRYVVCERGGCVALSEEAQNILR